MKRVSAAIVTLIALLVLAAGAQAAAPGLGALSATDIQGVSALLEGTVNPEGLPTTYFFEYTTGSNFAAAAKTPTSKAGSGAGPRSARAAISGLAPNTIYHYRLVATNSSGTTIATPQDFATTKGFGFLPGEAGFAFNAYADGGGPATQIGSHPYQIDFAINLNQGGEFEAQPGVPFPDGDLRDLRVQLPVGLIANPSALAKCTPAAFHTPRISPFEASRSGESCPNRTQVGTVEVDSSLGGGVPRRFGLYNLDPAPGIAAQLGFAPYGSPVVFDAEIDGNADGSYALVLRVHNFPQSLDLYGMAVSLWGTPWGASHDGERGDCLKEVEPGFPWAKCSVGDPQGNVPQAFLTLPTQCSGAFSLGVSASAWQQPAPMTAQAANHDSLGQEAGLSDCSALPFDPKPIAQLTDTKASSSTGFAFDLSNDNTALLDPAARAPSNARKAVITLPAGVTINPSVGAGLGVCSAAQYAAETAASAPGAGCPNASKIGQFRVGTPLLEEPLEGSVYLAQPYENPYASLIGVYLVARSPRRGVIVKLAGKIVPDLGTGRLTATFDGLPQIPYTDLTMSFRAGQRSLLVTPPACGAVTTNSEISPWAGTPSVNTLSASAISSGIGGGPCPSGTPPFSPGVIAGGVNSNVNSYTPYYVRLSRKDTEQEITSYSLDLPKGITGKLAGIPFCPDAAIEAARGRRGFAEAASPSCPQSSLIGHTLTGYGVGNALTYTEGRIYLAGPYHGQPLSIVTINPATVGPFDLGVVVIRSAFAVDPHTAQLQIDRSASDAIPHILDGVVLHLREIRIYLDRPQFTHNPSSCEASKLTSTVGGSGADFASSVDDTTASVVEPFQLLNCRTLGFQPKLGVRLRGGTRRGAFPQLRATFAARGPQDSNLDEIAVTIPHQMFLAQQHIKGICSKGQFEAGHCPEDSVYGQAVAYTPLFDDPLRGNVYLRSAPGRRLPDLVADLYSGQIRIILEGKIGPGRKGGIRAFFSDLPDEPLDRFTMTLYGGKRGLLTNSANICTAPPESSVEALAQNNLGYVFTSKLRGQCGKSGKKQRKRGGR